jgi:hypothetical protein
MTELVLRQIIRNPKWRHACFAVSAVACALLAAKSVSFADDGPVLRSGLWKFERTLETNGEPTNRLQTSGLPIDRDTTRCVDPTHALKLELAPLQFGVCSVKDLRKTDGGYVFEKICSGATPIKTELNVESDSAYTEVNEGTIGKISTKETLVAHRVGDCHPPG